MLAGLTQEKKIFYTFTRDLSDLTIFGFLPVPLTSKVLSKIKQDEITIAVSSSELSHVEEDEHDSLWDSPGGAQHC